MSSMATDSVISMSSMRAGTRWRRKASRTRCSKSG